METVLSHVTDFLTASDIANCVISRKFRNMLMSPSSILWYKDIFMHFNSQKLPKTGFNNDVKLTDVNSYLTAGTFTSIKLIDGPQTIRLNGDIDMSDAWLTRIEFDGEILHDFDLEIVSNGNIIYTLNYAYLHIMKWYDVLVHGSSWCNVEVSIKNYVGNLIFTFKRQDPYLDMPTQLCYMQWTLSQRFRSLSMYIFVTTGKQESIQHILVNDFVIYPKTLDEMYALFIKKYRPSFSSVRPPHVGIIIAAHNPSIRSYISSLNVRVNNEPITSSMYVVLRKMTMLHAEGVTVCRFISH